MPAPTVAVSPSTVVTEVPGRFCPIYVVDKRGPNVIPTSTTTSARLGFLPRTETIDSTFNTPVTTIDELGTSLHVGEYDDLPDAKVSISSYDAGSEVLSLLTGKKAPAASTTVYSYTDFNNANVDIIRQYADPAGNVFASMFQGDLVIEEFGFSLKSKSVAMESYSLTGFNLLKFKGYIITKAYVILAGDVSTPKVAGPPTLYGIPYASIIGTDEVPVLLPVPSGSQPPSYWIQNGSYRFLKIQKYNASTGWKTFPEVAPSGTAAPPAGFCRTTGISPGNIYFAVTDMTAGDVVLFTYCSYGCDALVGGNSIKTIYTNSPDAPSTADPIAIPTRLTPFTIAGNNIPRGQSLDVKMSLKRERAEGIGDTAGLYGPSAAPDVSVSLEVKQTDFSLSAILETGSPLGTDNGGSVTGDFYDPNNATRNQIETATALVATLYDPRNAGTTLKYYTIPAMVLNNDNDNATTKNAVTRKFTGADQTGGLTVSVVKP